jgi:hypothetical protein
MVIANQDNEFRREMKSSNGENKYAPIARAVRKRRAVEIWKKSSV